MRYYRERPAVWSDGRRVSGAQAFGHMHIDDFVAHADCFQARPGMRPPGFSRAGSCGYAVHGLCGSHAGRAAATVASTGQSGLLDKAWPRVTRKDVSPGRMRCRGPHAPPGGVLRTYPNLSGPTLRKRSAASAQNEAILLIHFSARYSRARILALLDERLPPALRAKCTPLLAGFADRPS